MSENVIMEFVETIIQNGIKNNLDNAIIKKAILDYGQYLIRKKYVNSNITNSIIYLSFNIDELVSKANNIEKMI